MGEAGTSIFVFVKGDKAEPVEVSVVGTKQGVEEADVMIRSICRNTVVLPMVMDRKRPRLRNYFAKISDLTGAVIDARRQSQVVVIAGAEGEVGEARREVRKI